MRLEKTQGGGRGEELNVQITSGPIHLDVELHEQLHKMQFKNAAEVKKYFSRLSEIAESCFPERMTCFRFDLISVFKLLTEALFDPETNQLVLINAVLFWFGCC